MPENLLIYMILLFALLLFVATMAVVFLARYIVIGARKYEYRTEK